MGTVIVVITVVKLATAQPPTKLIFLRSFGIIIQHSFHVLLHRWTNSKFCPSRLFCTKSTKMIISSGVPASNLGILITYFPEVVSLGVL